MQHRVRGENGKILSKMELAKELPRFINVELVEIGERFPFYEDYVKGSTSALVTAESRAKTQALSCGGFYQDARRLDGPEEFVVEDGIFHQPSSCDH